LLVAVFVLLSLDLSAQHYVKFQPAPPAVPAVRPPMPAVGYAYIESDWQWVKGKYVWHGRRWAKPPYSDAAWAPGHWRHTYQGWTWIAGAWKRVDKKTKTG